jgi:peptidoglycan hydrolase-like protein with peptidoglycan-binding domain
MMTNRLLLASIFCIALSVPAGGPEAQTTSGATQNAGNSFQQMVLDIQRMLTELGYSPGPVDGAMGERTRQAIQRYQSNTGLAVDGHPSEALRQHLRVTTGSAAPASASTGSAVAQPAAQPGTRKAAWQGQTISDALLRIAPSDSSVSRQRLAKGTELAVIRRQGAWLEVRVEDGGAEGWVKQVSVRAAETATAPSKTESGGFFANLARGVSRLLGGASETPQDQGNVTVGIRGLAPEDLASAVPNPGELDKMESFRADRDQAYRFASAEKLTAQTIEYIPDPDAAAPATGGSGGRD